MAQDESLTQQQEKYWKPKQEKGESRSAYQKRYFRAQRNYAADTSDDETTQHIESKLPASKRSGEQAGYAAAQNNPWQAAEDMVHDAAGAAAAGAIGFGLGGAALGAGSAVKDSLKGAGKGSAEKAVVEGAKKTQASAAHPSRQPMSAAEKYKAGTPKITGKPTTHKSKALADMGKVVTNKNIASTSVRKAEKQGPPSPRKVWGKPTKSRNDEPARMRSWEASDTSVRKQGQQPKPLTTPKSAPKSRPAAKAKSSAAKPSGAAAKPAKAAAAPKKAPEPKPSAAPAPKPSAAPKMSPTSKAKTPKKAPAEKKAEAPKPAPSAAPKPEKGPRKFQGKAPVKMDKHWNANVKLTMKDKKKTWSDVTGQRSKPVDTQVKGKPKAAAPKPKVAPKKPDAPKKAPAAKKSDAPSKKPLTKQQALEGLTGTGRMKEKLKENLRKKGKLKE